MSRRPSIIVGVLVLVVLVSALVGVQAVYSQYARPDQPIAFTHVTHAGVLQMDCTFCHRNVDKGSNAMVPAVQQCMFCHAAVTGEGGNDPTRTAEIAKVREAFDTNNPIDWIRVHRLPDTVRFVHSAHIKALSRPGMTTAQVCATCHGNVAEMPKVGQVRPLKMGDCVACHRQNAAPTDCTTCHK